MRLVVRVHDQLALIIGYGPGENGQPKAICVLDGGLTAVSLAEIELLSVPHKLRKRLKKTRREVKEPETTE